MFRRTLLLEELEFGFHLSFGGILYQCYSFLQQIQWKDLYVVQQLPRHAWVFPYPQWRQFIPRELIMCHAVLFFLQFPLLLFFFFFIPRHFVYIKLKKKQKLWLSDIIQISSLGKVIPSYLQDVTTPFPNLSRLEGVTLFMWLSPMVLSKPPNVQGGFFMCEQ